MPDHHLEVNERRRANGRNDRIILDLTRPL